MIFDNMTEEQIRIYKDFRTKSVDVYRKCLLKAKEANDAVVKLPHVLEDGSKVIHLSNIHMLTIADYYNGRASLIEPYISTIAALEIRKEIK